MDWNYKSIQRHIGKTTDGYVRLENVEVCEITREWKQRERRKREASVRACERKKGRRV